MPIHSRDWLVLDIATTAIPDVGGFLEEPSAPANYKDPEKIAAYIADKKREQAERCGLDPDLGRITAIGLKGHDFEQIELCHDEDAERAQLAWLAHEIERKTLITFNGLRFDLPYVMRRALYRGVAFPTLNLDRYRTPHVDLADTLSMRGVMPAHSLGFYVQRLGWTDLVKPLDGAEEARVPETGRWDELVASVQHDLAASYRLAVWMGVIAPVAVPMPEPVF